MVDEIFIDGQKLDISGDTGIYLTYRSNIFSDISKVTGNNSQTIKVPLTSINRRILGGSWAVGGISRYPYMRHSVDVYRDGVQLIRKGTAVLLKMATTHAEIAITWGVSDDMKSLFEAGAKINELPDDNNSIITWEPLREWGSYRQPTARYGFKFSELGVALHPVLSVAEILAKMQSESGVNFDFDKRPWEYDDLVIPVLKRESERERLILGASNTNTRAINKNGLIAQGAAAEGKACAPVLMFNSRAGLTDLIDYYDENNKAVLATKRGKVKIKIYGSLTLAFYYASSEVLPNARGGIYAFSKYSEYDQGEWVISKAPETIKNVGLVTYITFAFNGEEAVLDDTRLLCVSIDQWKKDKSGPQVYSSAVYNAGTLTIDAYKTEIGTNEDYPLFRNLPPLKQIDFLKAICQMYGLFAFTDPDGGLHFSSVDKLYENKQSAYDWTKYLIHDGSGTPEATEYVIGDEAQRNNMIYKDDNYAGFSSYYEIINKTLPKERDAVKLPFNTCAMATYPVIPLYSYEEDGDQLKLKYEADDSAYILSRFGYGIYSLGIGGVKWDTLIKNNYTNYVKLLRDAKVITCTLIMKPETLHDLDIRRPVYLSQYGAYFGVIELKTKAGYLAEVKLVKL